MKYCLCGHLEGLHVWAKELYCLANYKYDCECHNFKLDNLAFLEWKYNESVR